MSNAFEQDVFYFKEDEKDIFPVFSCSHGDIPVLLHIPHCSTKLPEKLLDGCIPKTDLKAEAELMADKSTDLLAKKFLILQIEKLFDGKPFIFESCISRILVDMERFDSDAEEMNSVGMGVVYTNTHDLKPLYLNSIPSSSVIMRKNCYKNYSSQLAKLSCEILSRFGKLVFLDIHSYAANALPYELHKEKQRPLLCLGADSANVLDFAKMIVAKHTDVCSINEPFSGSYCPLPLWQDPRVFSLMCEHRKDSYNLSTGEPIEAISSIHNDIIANVTTWVK